MNVHSYLDRIRMMNIADQAAKTAACPNNSKPGVRMRSPQKTTIQTAMKTQCNVEWKTGKDTAKRLRHMSQQPGVSTGLKLYGTIRKREHVVWIARLRTGHCHLNEYLNRFKIIETAECECRAERETVEYFLLKCELYDEMRDVLRRKVGAQGMRINVLLGDNTVIQDTIEYITSTGRFKLENR
jgi:hypothetical protein